MNALYQEFRGQGLTLLLVDTYEDRDLVAKAVKEWRYVAPVILDSEGPVIAAYWVGATPTAFVIDRDGTVLGMAIGPRSWAGPKGAPSFRRSSSDIRPTDDEGRLGTADRLPIFQESAWRERRCHQANSG